MRINFPKQHVIIITLFIFILFLPCSVFPQTPAPKDTSKTAEKKTAVKEKSSAPVLTEAEKKAKQEDFEKASDIKKAEWIEMTLDFGIQKDRNSALNFIPTVKDPGHKSKLSAKLITIIEKDTDIAILVKAMNTAAEMKLTDASEAVKSRLSHENEDVRIAAVYAVKDINLTGMKNDLIEILKKQDFAKPSNFTEAVIQTLSDFKASEMSSFAEEKITSNKTNMNLRLALILFLGRSGAVSSKDFLIARAKDLNEEVEIRAYAVNALSRLEAKDAAPIISEIMNEISGYPVEKKKKYANLLLHSITALVKLGDDSAYPRLIEILKNDNPVTRLKAISLIKDIKDKRAIDILKYKMKYDPSAQVQKAAKDALKAMDVDVETPEEKNKPAIQDKKPDSASDENKSEVKKRDDF